MVALDDGVYGFIPYLKSLPYQTPTLSRLHLPNLQVFLNLKLPTLFTSQRHTSFVSLEAFLMFKLVLLDSNICVQNWNHSLSVQFKLLSFLWLSRVIG